MKRLTKRYEGGMAYVSLNKVSAINEFECVGLPITKLADYEDLEERGYLLEIPCKVDSEVWYIDKYGAEVIKGVVNGFAWHRSYGFALNIEWDKPIRGRFNNTRSKIPFSKVDKTVFRTKTAAEIALQEWMDTALYIEKL